MDFCKYGEDKEERLGKKQAENILSVLRYEINLEQKLMIFNRHLVDQNSFIDSSKIGIQGANYGGFITGRVLEKDALSFNPLISCAIMESPLVDWKNYGNINVLQKCIHASFCYRRFLC